jgi:hypothetical protein
MRVYGSDIARNAEVAAFVEQKYGEGHSLRQIVKIIEAEYHRRYSPQTIKNHLDRQLALLKSIAQGDERLKTKLSETFDRIIPDLGSINAKTWEIMNSTKNDKIKLKCAAEIRKQLEFQTFTLERLWK